MTVYTFRSVLIGGSPVRTRFLIPGLVASLALLSTPLAAQQRQGSGGATFTKDVAPILQRSCVTCHRPGQIAPMSLRTYEEVRPWARSIKTRVEPFPSNSVKE